MKIYNTLTKKKEELVSVKPGQISMYACGPTVYNFFHIGNARPFIVFDTLRRYLKYIGYKVTFVQNFTDVDDKMINKAREEGITVKELGERYIDEYFKDAKALNVLPADVHPKATEHIAEIIEFVQELINKGHAYEVDGDVYYNVSSFKDYGKLSGQSLDELQAGARIDVSEQKRDPMDFALWKKQKLPDEIAWESPWGMGRPGWHIECSAMSMKYLGETFDIHGGGQDLIFPHHENEVAQSEGRTGKPFANYWMHNGYINVDNKKMSKSAGNFFMVRDVAKKYDLLVIRFFILSAHYRSPVNFADTLVEQAKTAFARIDNCRENLKHIASLNAADEMNLNADIEEFKKAFCAEMDEDLNTAGAIGQIFEFIKKINLAFAEKKNAEEAKKVLAALDEILDVLGIKRKEEEIPQEILDMVNERAQAKKEKNYALADEIRAKIAAAGFEVKDTSQGPKISKIN